MTYITWNPDTDPKHTIIEKTFTHDTLGEIYMKYYVGNRYGSDNGTPPDNLGGSNGCLIRESEGSSLAGGYNAFFVVGTPGNKITIDVIFGSSNTEYTEFSVKYGDSMIFHAMPDSGVNFTYLCSLTFSLPDGVADDHYLEYYYKNNASSINRTRYYFLPWNGGSEVDKETISQLQQQITNLNNTIDSLNEQVSNLTNQRDNLQSQLNTANGQISSLTSDKNSLQSQLNIANSNIATLNSQIESLNSQITQLQATIESLNATIISKNEEIEDLKQQLEDALDGSESNGDALMAQIAQLTADLNTANQKITQLQATIDELNAQIVEKNNQIDLLTKQLAAANTDKQNLLAEITNLNNTITELNRQITLLKDQIANSGNNNSALLEELSLAQEELRKLKADYEDRILAIEKRLSSTTELSTANKSEIEEIKESVVKDIMAQIGTPRFGLIPLPIGKQAIAATNELLSDPSTGHLYLKNKTGLVSKTKDNENRLDLMDDFIKSTWIAAIVDYSNYSDYSDSEDLYANSDGTFGSKTTNVALEKIPVKYSPMTEYIIAVKYVRGSISKAVFIDQDGTELACQKMFESDKTITYKLYNNNVTAETLYPKLTIGTDTAIQSILVYRTMSLKSIEEQDNSKFDPSLNPDNIIEGLYDKDSKEFTVNSSNRLKIAIPKDSIKCGHTNLIVVAKDNSATITCKTYFNNSFKESKDIKYTEITAIDGLKTGYARFEIPEMSNGNNWLEITTTSSTNVVLKHVIFDIIGIDLDQYYTKNESNNNLNSMKNEVINQLNTTINNNVSNLNSMIRKAGNNFGVTGGNGSSYSVSLSNVVSSDLINGFTVCIVPHVINNANCTLTINNIGTYQIRNLNNEALEAEYIKAGVPILMVKYGNYFFIRARFNLNADGDDPTVKPGGGTDGPSKNEVIDNISGSVSTSYTVDVIRILAKNLVLVRLSYYGHNDVYQLNLDSMAMKKVISNANGDRGEMMKKWKDKYYIYGTKIYDLKYTLLKEYTKETEAHYEQTKDDDKGEVTNFSKDRQNNTLILDSTDMNKLYYINVIGKEWDEYHQHRTNYDNCFTYERCDVEVFRVNDDFSLTRILYYSNSSYWDESKIIAIKGNYMYALQHSKTGVSSNSRGIQVIKVDMSNGETVKPGSSTTTEFGNNNGYYNYLYCAPCREYWTTSSEYTEYGYLEAIHSQEVNRYIRFSVDQTSSTSRHDYTYEYFFLYDIIDEKEVNYASETTTKKEGRSRRYYFTGNNLTRDFVTNNPNVFSSRYEVSEDVFKRSLFGLIDKKNFSVQEINLDWAGHYTSKYRFTIGMTVTRDTVNGVVTSTKFAINIQTWKL